MTFIIVLHRDLENYSCYFNHINCEDSDILISFKVFHYTFSKKSIRLCLETGVHERENIHICPELLTIIHFWNYRIWVLRTWQTLRNLERSLMCKRCWRKHFSKYTIKNKCVNLSIKVGILMMQKRFVCLCKLACKLSNAHLVTSLFW